MMDVNVKYCFLTTVYISINKESFVLTWFITFFTKPCKSETLNFKHDIHHQRKKPSDRFFFL